MAAGQKQRFAYSWTAWLPMRLHPGHRKLLLLEEKEEERRRADWAFAGGRISAAVPAHLYLRKRQLRLGCIASCAFTQKRTSRAKVLNSCKSRAPWISGEAGETQ